MLVTTGRRTGPRPARESWVIAGLTLQILSVAGAAAFAWIKLRHQGIGGHITAATIRLAWHSDVYAGAGLAVLAAAAVIYAAGSILMARPYVSRPVTLFIAVPAAAVAGMLALGAVALIVALVLAVLANDVDVPLDIGSLRRPKRPPRSGTPESRGGV